jgi:hypothetical protein
MVAETSRTLRLMDVAALLAVAILSGVAGAQSSMTQSVASARDSTTHAVAGAKDSTKRYADAPFFASQDPIDVTLTANIGKIRGDKGSNAPWRPAALSYTAPEGKLVTVPIKARTRGIWRLRMCDFPPLRLNFSGQTAKGTIFQKLDKPKLVSYCQNGDTYEQYVLQEYQLYRIYQLITPVSHKARLMKLAYADSADGKVRARRYSFLLEEPGALAARLGGTVRAQKGASPGDLEPVPSALFGVFQYFIGNTDFSVAGLHNVELFFSSQGEIMPIAYDFDFAGAVNARYATSDERLNLPNVRQRLFRGYCTDPQAYDKAFAVFNEKKPEIYALYSDSVGKLMDRGTVKETLRYFDEFYETINNKRAAKRSIVESCIGSR